MSSEVHALEQRLREDPTDDLSWQVYGDWLAQRGDPRGELIALVLARGGPELAPRIKQLEAEQVEALGSAGTHLAAHWYCGFLLELTEDALEYPHELDMLGELLARPQLRLLTRLTLGFTRGEDEPLNELDGLEFFGAREDTVSSVARLDLRTIHSLGFPYSGAGDELAEALAGMELSSLRELDLRYCRLSDAGVRALASNHSLSELRELHLQGNALSSPGIETLAKWPALAQLELLDLRNNAVYAEGAHALGSSPVLGALEVLHLRDIDVRREGCEALASSTTLRPELARLWRARSANFGR